jgi:hypothetical protein
MKINFVAKTKKIIATKVYIKIASKLFGSEILKDCK